MKPPDPTLSEILRAAPQLTTLCERLGINTSRCGDQSLAEVCGQHGLDASTLVRVLAAWPEEPPSSPAVVAELLTLEELCEHIEHTQHGRLLAEMAELDKLTRHAAKELGGTHLLKIRAAFQSFRAEFATHLQEETEVLFASFQRPPKRDGLREHVALKSCLARLAREHSQMDEALAELGSLVDGEKSRGPLSSAARKISAAISRLHQIVHEQIYTENQILFPKFLAQRSAW